MTHHRVTPQGQAPERASECGLTECYGKPMCAKCLKQETPWSTALAELMKLTDEQRLQAFLYFCRSCGSTDPGCQCWNDE